MDRLRVKRVQLLCFHLTGGSAQLASSSPRSNPDPMWKAWLIRPVVRPAEANARRVRVADERANTGRRGESI